MTDEGRPQEQYALPAQDAETLESTATTTPGSETPTPAQTPESPQTLDEFLHQKEPATPEATNAAEALRALMKHGMLAENGANVSEYGQMINSPEGQKRLLQLYQEMNDSFSEEASELRKELIGPDGVFTEEFFDEAPELRGVFENMTYDQLKHLQENGSTPASLIAFMHSMLQVERLDEVTPSNPTAPEVAEEDIQVALDGLRNQTLEQMTEKLAGGDEDKKKEFTNKITRLLQTFEKTLGLSLDLTVNATSQIDWGTFLQLLLLGEASGYNNWHGTSGETGSEQTIGKYEFGQLLKNKPRSAFIQNFKEAYLTLSKPESEGGIGLEIENGMSAFDAAIDDDEAYVKIFDKLVNHLYSGRDTDSVNKVWSVFSSVLGSKIKSGRNLHINIKHDIFDKMAQLREKKDDAESRSEYLSFLGLKTQDSSITN